MNINELAGEIMTVSDVANVFKRSRSWVYNLVKVNEIPHQRKNGTLIFTASSLDKWANGGIWREKNTAKTR